MKDFFKYMAATVVGLIVFTLLTGVLGVMCIAGMIASESSAKDVSDNTVMVLNLSGVLNERSEESIMDQLSGSTVGNMGLDDILDAIKKAKNNDKIKGIYIEAGMFGADSYASMQAIRNALKDFKKSGKWIVAYGDVYTQGTYYIASVADKIFLNPSGQIDWRSGFAADIPERHAGKVWREDAAGKGGHIQERSRNVHCRQDERRQPRTGYGLY